jgi:hypothetical protein
MSRSFKRHSFSGWVCYSSNKLARSYANRALRRANKAQAERDLYYLLREKSDVWCFPSDGLATYWPEGTVRGCYLRILSFIQAALNCCNTDHALQHYPWCFHGFAYEVKELCEYLGKPFSLATLESVSNEKAMKFAMYTTNKWLAR